MREIKFRGYSDGYEQWKEGFGVSVSELSKSMQKDLGVKEIVYLHTYGGKMSVVPESVGQYTDRKDIYGLDIHDGDILQSDCYPCGPEDDYVLVVEYDDGCFWATKRLKVDATARGISDGMAEPLYELEGMELKIIGNVFENKELLEAE